MTKPTHHANLITGGTRQQREERANLIIHEILGEATTLHPDLTSLQKEAPSSNIGIDKVRELKMWAQLKPSLAKQKVISILEAQSLTLSAQNALLKILEEPPKRTIFVLTTAHQARLLPTIASRCAKIRLAPKIDLRETPEDVRALAQEFSKLLRVGEGKRLDWVEENLEKVNESVKLVGILNVWLSVFRDILLIKLGLTEPLTNSSLKSELKGLAEVLPQANLCRAIDELQKNKVWLETTNVNPRLCLEVLLLKLPIASF